MSFSTLVSVLVNFPELYSGYYIEWCYELPVPGNSSHSTSLDCVWFFFRVTSVTVTVQLISTLRVFSALLTDEHPFHMTWQDMTWHFIQIWLFWTYSSSQSFCMIAQSYSLLSSDKLSSATFTNPTILPVPRSLTEVLSTLSITSPTVIQTHLLFSVSPLLHFPCQLFSLGWDPRSNPTCLRI